MNRTRVFVACMISCSVLFFVAFAPHDNEDALDSIANSAAPGIGGDGPFAANNIAILGRLSLAEMGAGPGNVLGNDCWGWTDPLTDKEYAICGLTNATSFIDISNPANPQYLGRLLTETGNTAWRDMKVYENHCFIVADFADNHGMQVFDLTQLRTADPNTPQNFSAVALYNGVSSAHNVVINEDTGFAYIVGSNRASGGLHVVNIQNPTNPIEAGNFSGDGYTHDAQVVSYVGPDSDYASDEIAFACNEDTLTIVNVTDKNNMFQISRNGYSQSGYTHQCWLSEDHRYLYLGDEFDEANFGGKTRILVWDCLNLDSPIFLGNYLGETNAIDHNIYVRGDKVFVSNYSAGLRVLQIDPNDPLNLTEVAFVDTFMTDNDADFDGVWSNYPYFDSGVIVVSDRQNGMFLVQLTQLEFDFPASRPSLINPLGQVEFSVAVSGFDGTPAANTGVLHVDSGNGFESFPMNEVSTNLYEAAFPATQCGSVVQYYISAMSTNGIEVCVPADAPTTTYSATSADSVQLSFQDSFESDGGWSVMGNADNGHWERGVPQGDGQRGDPLIDGDGSGSCYLTENLIDNSDVDGGTTTLTSPVMDAVGDGTGVAAFINYYRWYSNDVGNAPASDLFVIEISNDDGQSWSNLETVGPSGNEVSGGWFFRSFEVSSFVVPTSQMRLRFSASDLGDGSVVEAGVDGVEIVLIQCKDDNVLLGDVNMDGVVNLLDVSPFVNVLSTAGFQLEADMNQDGFVNLLDVELFIAALAG